MIEFVLQALYFSFLVFDYLDLLRIWRLLIRRMKFKLFNLILQLLVSHFLFFEMMIKEVIISLGILFYSRMNVGKNDGL